MSKIDFHDKTLDCMLEELDTRYSNMFDFSANLNSFYGEGTNPVSGVFGRKDINQLSKMVDDYRANLRFVSWTINRRYGELQDEGYFFVTRDKDGKHHYVDTRTSIVLEDAGGEALF